MNANKLLRFATMFYSLAAGEEIPPDTRNYKTILENLTRLETYQARKQYAENNLKHLSSGSSRIVYLSPDKNILKMAKNDKGLAQNRAEANPKMQSKYLNKIIGHAPNYSWIETYYLDKISKPEFEDMTGLRFDDFGDSIRYALKNVSGNTDLEKPPNFAKVEKSEIYKELKRIGEQFKLMPGDLARISSWGTKDGHPILIDAGLTADVFSDYYEDDSKSNSS